MQAGERHETIINLVKENNIILIGEISNTFGVSLETARRDLEALQDMGIVKRIHGGAVYVGEGSGTDVIDSYLEKKSIGICAAKHVNNGDTLFIDVGSTTLELARNLKSFKELTVITNSLPVINELVNTDVHVIVLGGELRSNEQFIYNNTTEQMISNYFVDKAFFSCGGLRFDDGITDYGAVISRANIRHQSKEMILLADSSKFGHNANIKACSLDIIDRIIVDSNISSSDLSRLRKYNFAIDIADTDTV